MTKPNLLLNANEKILLEGRPQSRFMVYLSLINFISVVIKIFMLLFVIYAFLLFTNQSALKELLVKLIDPSTLQELGGIPGSQQLGNIYYAFPFFQAGVLQHFATVKIALVIVFILSISYSKIALGSTWYFLTNQRLVFYSGVLLKRKQNIFYPSVSDINNSSNILQTLLKLTCLSITLVTATKKRFRRSKQEYSTVVMNGLSAQQAEQISSLVMQHRQEMISNNS